MHRASPRPVPSRTPLYDVHQALGARFTDFAGWSMPLRYTSETAEHHAVRASAGLFDLSHMGQISVTGPEAGRALDYALVGSFASLAVGSARYTMLCHGNGGVLDDLVVYRLEPRLFLVVANAANAAVVLSELRDRFDGFGAYADLADDRALIAVQGPAADRILACPQASALRYYQAAAVRWADRPVVIARTGYTGEDGFELFCRGEDAAELWSALIRAGEPHGLRPAGLACRDTLRLEAGMPLHGNELHVGVSPYEANLGRVVDLANKGDFVGRRALAALAAEPPQSTLVGLTSAGRRAARAGHPILDPADGHTIGRITSGAPSPTLGHPIALGYVLSAYAETGRGVAVSIRGTDEPFVVTAPRFYRRKDIR
ncbi:glycine cleavage system aminomethyltransferase GcvT [Hamadaea tsunoensis]|uniref:glycine cleavage system aminomethyltransferase GcvT n=1 Tax=Hamadaea tsunoensis TaxID=53368 RepID=UPI0004248C0E|nr:glycine cleavage system aminomethyltransferase GcvT [Hamadaea tsunoensis]